MVPWGYRRRNFLEPLTLNGQDMGRFKFYIFSTSSLRFVEARWAKTKLAAATLVVAGVLSATVFEANQSAGDVLGLGVGRGQYLTAENKILRAQLEGLTGRLQSLEDQLLALNSRDNELRLTVNLSPIDKDVRQVGVGGKDERVDFGVDPTVNALLQSLSSMVGRAERELELQAQSYKEVVAAYESNQDKFARIPAIKPMRGYYDVNSFGMRLHPVLRIMKPHEGLDIAADVGNAVYATGDGVIQFSGRTGGGYGIAVEVKHGYGYTSFYAHLSKVLVREGQRVKRGDLLALSGRTGLVSGPHLHYEVRLNGMRQNPIDYFFDDVDARRFQELLAESGARPTR